MWRWHIAKRDFVISLDPKFQRIAHGQRRQHDLPIAVGIRGRLMGLVGDSDGHIFPSIGVTPNTIFLATLKYHRIAENVG
jgi:hypothetical protein